MNLNVRPTLADLQNLFRSADDTDGHHILWVDTSGEVRLNVLPHDLTPNDYESRFQTMRMRYETFAQGCGYTGPDASEDTEFMHDLFASLLSEWADKASKSGCHYIDWF